MLWAWREGEGEGGGGGRRTGGGGWLPEGLRHWPDDRRRRGEGLTPSLAVPSVGDSSLSAATLSTHAGAQTRTETTKAG